MPESHAATGHRIVKGMFVIIFFGLFLKLGAYMIRFIVFWYYGAGEVADAYSHVFRKVIYLLVYSTVLKVIVPAFMPLFSQERQERGEAEAWKLLNTLMNLCLIGGVALSIGAFVFAPEVVRITAPDWKDARFDEALRMVRGMSPGILVFVFAVMAMAVLNSYKVFSYPSAGEAVQKFIWAAGLVFLAGLLSVHKAAAPSRPVIWAFLIGCLAQAVILLYGMRDKRSLYRPGLPATSMPRVFRESAILAAFAAAFVAWWWAVQWAGRQSPASWFGQDKSRALLVLTGGMAIGWAYAGLLWFRASRSASAFGRFAVLAAPLLIGVLFARYRDLALAVYQAGIQMPGVYSVIDSARQIADTPTIVVAYSLSIAMFPFLCDLAVRETLEGFAHILDRAVRMIALFFVPMTVVMIVCAPLLVQLVWDRGNWDPVHVRYGGVALAAYTVGLFFYAIENVLMQSFFSLQRMVLPTVLGMALSVVNVAMLPIMVDVLRFNSDLQVLWIVSGTFMATRALKNVILYLFLRRRAPLESWPSLARFGARLAVVTVVVGGASLAAYLPAARWLSPDRYRGVLAMLDTFNLRDEAEAARANPDAPGGGRGIAWWRATPGCQMRLDALAPEGRQEERALLITQHVGVTRDMERLPAAVLAELRHATRLTFKAKSEAARVLKVRLQQADGKDFAARIEIARSDDRKTYAVPLSAFSAAGVRPAPDKIARLSFEEADSPLRAPRLWLDNVAFDRPLRRLAFEASKCVIVGVTTMAAMLAFVAACAALRMQEFLLIVNWARSGGWRKAREAKAAVAQGPES